MNKGTKQSLTQEKVYQNVVGRQLKKFDWKW